MRKIIFTVNNEENIRKVLNELMNRENKWRHDGIRFHNGSNKPEDMFVNITVFCKSNAEANKIKYVFKNIISK